MNIEYDYDHESLLDDELQFWKSWFETKGRLEVNEPDWHGGYVYRTDSQSEANVSEDHWYLSGISANDEILDIGCGPVPVHGATLNGERLKITGVDPLAEEYNKLIEEYTPQVEFRGVKGTGETLLDIFSEGQFDRVVSTNALDCSYNPILCIQNMLKVCKKGGLVKFALYENIGHSEEYKGLHKWNFTARTLIHPLSREVLPVRGSPEETGPYDSREHLLIWNEKWESLKVEEAIDYEYIKTDLTDRYLKVEIKK